jgi:probable rRNA maturation factor
MITLDLPTEHAASSGATQAVAALRPYLLRAQKAIGLDGQVHVLLTSDDEIRVLNRAFRHKNRPTDVLSFPAAPLHASRPRSRAPRPAEKLAGDIAISIETASRQAARYGHTLVLELKILLLHGLLHLAGYDHEADAGEMQEIEASLRRRFRLPGTLILRSSHGARAAAQGRAPAATGRVRP